MRHEGITGFSLLSLPSPKSCFDVAKRPNHSKSNRAKRSQFVASLLCKVTPMSDIICGNEIQLLEWGTRLVFFNNKCSDAVRIFVSKVGK